MGTFMKLLAAAPRSAASFNKKAFFNVCRQTVMGPKLDAGEVSGAEFILDAMRGAPLSWTAYALATAWHETAHTMQPIKEHGGPRYFFRMYDPNGDRPALARANGNVFTGDGALYCGRGYVQLTWRNNYKNAAAATGYPLEGNPDLAMRPDIAAIIMREGMEQGWFTGRSLSDFLPIGVIPATHENFVNARRIINGTDKARLIATHAMAFQAALLTAGWKP